MIESSNNFHAVFICCRFQCQLVDFLLLRNDSKKVILLVCKEMLFPANQATLTTIASIFNKLNRVYWKYLQDQIQSLVSQRILAFALFSVVTVF